MELVDTFRRETRLAVRALARTPSFTLIVVLTLALGLGAATTIFTLLDRVVLRPLPYPHAERLVHIGTLWPKIKAGEEYALSRGQFFYFKRNSAALENLGLYSVFTLPIDGDGSYVAERVQAVDASASLFEALGIVPARGRLFTAEEGRREMPSVALVSDGYWKRRFGGDPAILGKRLKAGDITLEIIGVLPPGAHVPEAKADVWIPKYLEPNDRPVNNHTHTAIGLLKPGVTLEAASADIKRLQDRFAQEHPDVYPASFIQRVGFAMNVTWLRDFVVGGKVVRTLWTVFAGVAFVLLIAAANVANLFLVRIDARRRESAVRTALGANRAQLAVHYLAESLLLSVVAAAAAIALGYGLLRTVLVLAPQSLPRLDEVSFDARAILFCVTASLLFGTVFGLLSLASARLDVATLREGGRGLTASKPRELARRSLVVVQVGLAVVLLTGAVLMVKSFMNLRSVKPGFDPSGVHVASISLPAGRYRNAGQVAQLWKELVTRVEALPGVTRAGLTEALPLASGSGCTAIITDATTGERGQCMPLAIVTPGYFETMGIKIEGAAPSWSSVQAAEGPVVVSAAFARRFWPGERVVGRGVQPFGNRQVPYHPIVGVAEDVRANGLQNPPIEIAYLPLVARSGAPFWNVATDMQLVVRAPSVDTRTLMTAVRNVLTSLEPQAPMSDIQSMEAIVARSMAQTSFTMLLLLVSATIALTLSAVGIYGVIAYLVSQRRAEIGIRMALGAGVAEVARMVVGQSVTLAAVGASAGVVVAIAAMRVLQSLLFEVKPTDPLVLAGTCAALLLIALVASAGPARRAARIDPVEAMRSQ